MLGTEVLSVLGTGPGKEVTGWSRMGADYGHRPVDATSAQQVVSAFADQDFDVCVHCVANADVQQCQDDPQAARQVNAETTRIVAESCARHGVKLVYISTEYVFDGTAENGYAESDTPAPLQIYGRTKREGELHASRVPGHLIVRLPVLYGARVAGRGPTWTEKLLHALERHEPVELDDRFERQPTWTHDVAVTLKRAVEADLDGVLHVAAQEGLTKYAWGRKIAEATGMPVSLVRPANTSSEAPVIPKPARPWLRTERLEGLGVRPPGGVSHRLSPFLRSIGVLSPAGAD
ncbi:dTDP-4-dehydrorhamnose reductase [Streptomyces sp. LBL]|nr:dTDP-4-dehydrorhamnose reductase [Streptomyces sp. LBL]